MPSEWPEVRLEDVTTILGDGLHGTPEYDDAGDYFFVNGSNLCEGRIVFDEKTRRVSEKEYKKHQKNLNDRTVLVSINGTIGNVALFCGENVVLGKSACYFNVIHSVDKHYIYYVLSGLPFKNYINKLATGSTIKNVSLRLMRDFSFLLPPPKEQERITSVLRCLDDRITLLRETNTTLEAIAQALFKSWFVDFDPVRTKAEDREPEGMPPEVADLFPAELLEAELGTIPSGWRQGVLGDVLTLRNERAAAGKMTAALPYVPVECISPRTVTLEQHRPGEEAQSSLILFKGGDILFGAMRPYFHKVCLAPFDGVTRTTVFTLMPKTPELRQFALLTAFQTETVEYATNHSQGSTIPYAKWKKSLELKPVVVPPLPVARAFGQIVEPLLDRASANIRQVALLAALRDTLLPRLMSGKLRISDVEKALEAV
ncbi:Type I restriction-modification system specificity protein [Magnetospirillum gryphiswaldense MSR-1 v2]|uniref:Type I restriction-modification system specificity protein n=1 Tax=Magnetospirillum gryphiswaldense (strain DSM 6361 / JCM 21280 / NBRC 15271 / MSR-1) TaxID=431944 RepID=V6F4F4_MAGGM|nr:restriction endonuclease subunit S [Magnetospirillum gryphiswaldense]CDL00262.1 Type I restriction-modification system specificity protein [Magnetospirillum gryphiswaldense MSR-1 v2]